MKAPIAKTNVPFDTREGWLRAATDKLRVYFESRDHKLPGDVPFAVPTNIRFAVAFPSTGKRGQRRGEAWAPTNADGFFEVYLRADLGSPTAVLAELTRQLVHTALPLDAQHGKLFRDAALIVGLKPPMRKTVTGKPLQDLLSTIADELGPLPHEALDIAGSPIVSIAPGSIALNLPKKQRARMLKAECLECKQADNEYLVRISGTTATGRGSPLCPQHKVPLSVEWPKEAPEAAEPDESTEGAEGGEGDDGDADREAA